MFRMYKYSRCVVPVNSIHTDNGFVNSQTKSPLSIGSKSLGLLVIPEEYFTPSGLVKKKL